MSAAVYDVGYDTRMIKKRKNLVIVWRLAAKKEKKTWQNINRPKNTKSLKHTATFML